MNKRWAGNVPGGAADFNDAYDRNKRKLWVAYSLAVLPLALFGVGLAFVG